jgi:hypothetical protein
MDEHSNSDVYPWRSVADESPPRNVPVWTAWKHGGKWYFWVAKFTGKRWLDSSSRDVEEYIAPHYWQEIKSPDEIATLSAGAEQK